jgi:secreted PhoX family phosphatase
MSTKSFHTLDLSRRSLLRGAVLATGAGVLVATGMSSQARAASKVSQNVANYQPTPKGSQRCNSCSQWLQPTDCKVVNGPISPTGWCSLYAPKW